MAISRRMFLQSLGAAATGAAMSRLGAAAERNPVTAPDLAVLSAAQKSELDQVIARHRMGTITIRTKPGARVRVEQLRHEFWFGAAIPDHFFGSQSGSPDAEKFRQTFLELFNSAVTENALKWHNMERERGRINYATIEAILKWTEEHQIPLRGHNIFWGIPRNVQDWLKQMGDDELRQTLRARALDIGRRFRGRFAEYDLNNEMIHGNYYQERLGPQITKQMADWVREGDPSAVLCLNDYDILTGRRTADYVAHIRKLLGQGVPIGVIGVQGHSHGMPFDSGAMRKALDDLAQFKIPIRVTEFNMPGQNSKWYKDKKLPFTPEDEEAQARAIVDFYRIAFAHPAVAGILMWGFWEGADWIPASALYRRDWTPKPAARSWRELVRKEWWTNWEGTAGADGKCEVRAFCGRHRVSAEGRESTVELKRAEGAKSVAL